MPTSALPLLRIDRGEVEEGIQRGHLVAVDASGTLVTSKGDPSRLTYFRSCAKPFQAIAALRTGVSALATNTRVPCTGRRQCDRRAPAPAPEVAT